MPSKIMAEEGEGKRAWYCRKLKYSAGTTVESIEREFGAEEVWCSGGEIGHLTKERTLSGLSS